MLSLCRTIATAVMTLWGALKSFLVICSACSASVGFPMIWPLKSATVSAPITMLLGYFCAMLFALAKASSAANSEGARPFELKSDSLMVGSVEVKL